MELTVRAEALLSGIPIRHHEKLSRERSVHYAALLR